MLSTSHPAPLSHAWGKMWGLVVSIKAEKSIFTRMLTNADSALEATLLCPHNQVPVTARQIHLL